ncbi:hypothetical protein E4T47_02015 [Aureobasidium subglaciale]|nr:hypothetical protein E4T47_02015 [Aureobasidium subglaciale]
MDSPRLTETQQKRKRASRKNTPKRFNCDYEGCTKIYSRHEHLQRHQLNHQPKEVFRCQAEGCDQTFVRLDLCMRHQARHGELLTIAEQDAGTTVSVEGHTDLMGELGRRRDSYHLQDAEADQQPTRLEVDVADAHQDVPLQTEGQAPDWIQTGMLENHSDFLTTSPQQGNENFASWLFDSPGSQQQNFDPSNFLPYVNFGLDYCSPINDLWQFDVNQSAITAHAHNALAASPVADLIRGRPHAHSHAQCSAELRSRVVSSINSFLGKKRPQAMQSVLQEDALLFSPDGRDLPNVTNTVLEDCLASFWKHVAIQMPILHHQTFSNDDCPLLLILAITMLGAGQIVRSHPVEARDDHRILADLIAINLRWDILPEAEPPITLWVAQTLLLLEFYEKMFSTRRLHERAYIHHASTLALLRRGSPMVGHAEDEEPPTRCPSPGPNAHQTTGASKQLSWWRRWARNESWHRVVFAALQMDTLHAVAFGHESSLLPYELRLPLPCDDSLWSASSPEDVWRLEETFAMHGIIQQPFLDSLKRCLHGYEVQSNHGARMILGSGLLSIGWHIRRRERNQQFLETIPTAQESERWRTLLLNAYSRWCQSFQSALEKSRAHSRKHDNVRDVVFNPTIILRLGYLTTHIDILDAQVFAGTKRLLGRKITDKDYVGCSTRMRNWALSSSARLAVAHAFDFLNETLVETSSATGQLSDTIVTIRYTCRSDASIYRPWVLYLAALSIWSYQFALKVRVSSSLSQRPSMPNDKSTQNIALQYIQSCVRSGIDTLPSQVSAQGCAALCKFLSQDFANAEWELLLEASRVLDSCATMIMDG